MILLRSFLSLRRRGSSLECSGVDLQTLAEICKQLIESALVGARIHLDCRERNNLRLAQQHQGDVFRRVLLAVQHDRHAGFGPAHVAQHLIDTGEALIGLDEITVHGITNHDGLIA